jgi:hypothetical protein
MLEELHHFCSSLRLFLTGDVGNVIFTVAVHIFLRMALPNETSFYHSHRWPVAKA